MISAKMPAGPRLFSFRAWQDLSAIHSCDIPQTIKDALPDIQVLGFEGRQTHRIIFYGEKSSLAPILRPIAEQIGAEMILDTGEFSERTLRNRPGG
jgi:hypothetical protein